MATSYVPDPTDVSRPYDSDFVKLGAAELRALKRAFNAAWTPKIILVSDYTMTSDDMGQLLVMRNGGTIRIPSGLTPGLFGVTGLQQTTVQMDPAFPSGKLLVPPSLMSTLYEDYAFAVVMKVSDTEFLISGNLMFNLSSDTLTPDRTVNPISELQAQMVSVNTELADHEDRIELLEEEVFPPPFP